MSSVPRGLYVITDAGLIGEEQLVPAVAKAIQGGAVMVQYRDKGDDRGRRIWEAQDLLTLCRPLGVPLIINDDMELAAAVGADGVHLGTEDGDVAAARERLGPQAIIGATCHADLDLARTAMAAGASYVAFGRFFPSHTKPGAPPADVDLLARAHAEIPLPIAAIGGINPDNAPPLITAGAQLLAVVHGVFAQSDIRATAQAYASLFEDK